MTLAIPIPNGRSSPWVIWYCTPEPERPGRVNRRYEYNLTVPAASSKQVKPFRRFGLKRYLRRSEMIIQMRNTMFDNRQKLRNTATAVIIFLLVPTLLFTAGCSDVGHKPLTFKIWVLKIDADGDEQWTTTIGGDPNGMGTEMVQTRDGGYAIVGTGTGPERPPVTQATGDGVSVIVNGGAYSIIRIVTLDAGGDAVLDIKTDTSPDSGRSLVEATAGGYAVTTRLGYLKHIDESGNVLWSTKLGEEPDQGSWTVVRAPDGGYAAAGNNQSVRLDEDGTILWQTAFASDQSASTIITAPSGGFVTGGTCDAGVWVTQLNAEGDIVWNRTFTTESPVNLYIVRLSPDSTYDLIYGTEQHVSENDQEDKWITETTEVSLSADGQMIGEKPVQVSRIIVATEDGGYAYCGYSHPQHNDLQSHGRTNAPLRVVRLDTVGDVVWDSSFDIGDNRPVTSIIQTADGGFAIFGEFHDF